MKARIVKVKSDHYEVWIGERLYICHGQNAAFYAHLIAGEYAANPQKGGGNGQAGK